MVCAKNGFVVFADLVAGDTYTTAFAPDWHGVCTLAEVTITRRTVHTVWYRVGSDGKERSARNNIKIPPMCTRERVQEILAYNERAALTHRLLDRVQEIASSKTTVTSDQIREALHVLD